MRVSQVNDKPVPMETPVTLITCKTRDTTKDIIYQNTFEMKMEW